MSDQKLLCEMGCRIAERRKKMGLSQEELAEKADVSAQMLSTAERGTKALRPENLLKLSKALEVSADYLLTGDINQYDFDIITNKISHLSPEKIRIIERIIDECVELSK